MSWNLMDMDLFDGEGFHRVPWQADAERVIADTLKRVNPEVILIVEAPSFTELEGFVERNNLNYHVVHVRQQSGRRSYADSMALLSRVRVDAVSLETPPVPGSIRTPDTAYMDWSYRGLLVAEYGEPGVKFIVRGSPWKIIDVYGDKIYVKPVDDPTGAIPSWVGEEIPVPFEVALEVGWIRRFVEEELKKGENENRIVEKLVKRYPASKATVREAIKEVVEQVEKGLPVPSDKVVTVEEWENYIILQCCFGSLVNRTLARILGHVFSEEYGETVGVQEDPYRIVIQREGSINAESLIRTILSLSEKNVREIVVEAVVKTGLFKRRLVHVARKFGALAKWADFSEFTLKQLVKSFEGTVIFEEALRDTLETDMDVGNVEKVLRMIRDGEIKILAIRRRKETSPIARIGVERISRKTDLIPPEKMRSILIESAKARLLNEVGVFVCLRCWNFVKPIRIKNLPEKIRCPECGSKMVGLSKESEDKILKLAEKKGRNLKGRELDLYENLLETAELISKYGYAAAVALVGHGLKPRDVEDILAEHPYLDDEFYERIIEAERKALKRRFW